MTEVDAWQVLDLLTSLVDKSLVVYEEGAAGQGRYRLLETVRQYATDRLTQGGEEGAVRDRHLTHFLTLAETLEPGLHGPAQARLLDLLEAEHDNLRAALTWGGQSGGEAAALRLAGALSWFWHLRAHFGEGIAWTAQALERTAGPEPTPARARALQGAGQLAYYAGDHAGASALFQESARLWRALGDGRGLASALVYGGCALWERGDLAAGEAALRESVALARAQGDRWVLAMALWMLGVLYTATRPPEAPPVLEESATLFRVVGDRWGLAGPLLYLAKCARRRGDPAAARVHYGEAASLSREVGDPFRQALALAGLTEAAVAAGDRGAARAHLRGSLALLRETGGAWGVAFALEAASRLEAAEGRPGKAVRLFAAAQALRAAVGFPMPPQEAAEYDDVMDPARLGEAGFGTARAAGAAMTPEEAIAHALADEEARDGD